MTIMTGTSSAQLPQYHAQVFGEEQGIGSDLMFDIFIDKEGFVWATTPSALQRFDGRDVHRYPFAESISHALCDADGRIWALAGQSIWRNRDDWKGFEQIPFDTSGGVLLRGIFQMVNHPFTILASNGLNAWNEKTGIFDKLGKNIPKPGNRHNISRIDTCGNVLFYPVGGGICTYDLSTDEVRKVPFYNEFAHLFAVTPDLAVLTDYLENSYWLDFISGKTTPIDAKHYGLSPTLHKVNILGFAPLPGGQFLVNTKFGLCEYDLKSDSFHLKNIYAGGKPLDNNQVMRRIFYDKSGTIWAHTLNNILAISPLKNSIGLLRNYHYSPPNEWNDRTFGITEDKHGNLWFGSTYGFKKLDLKRGKFTGYQHTEGATDRLSHYIVRGMASDEKYIILGPTFNGVWLFDPLTERYRRPVYTRDSVRQKLEGDYIDYIGTMRNGDHIVCGRYYLYCIKAKSYRVDFIHFQGDKSNMNTVTQDASGRIWLGSERGIYCLDEQYRFLFQVPVVPFESVHCIFQKGENEMLVGTSKGLRRITLLPDSTRVDRIPSPVEGIGVGSIFKDSLQRFWLGTFDGLYLTDNELTNFQKFDFSDNIQSFCFNPGTCRRASNGMLFMGGQNGINYFYPEKIETEDRPLSVTIQSLSINDGDSVLLWPGGRLEFPFHLNTLTFEVVAPYYNNAGRVQYRYRIHPGGAWIVTGNSFRLPDLPAGNYNLEVGATITGKIWYEAKKTLAFKIAKPYWQTWPFRLSLVAAFGAVVFGLVRHFESRERRRQQEQLELEKLKNTNLLYQLETEQVVNYFSRSIGNQSTVDGVLWDVAQQCISRLGWEDCVIYLLDPARNVLVQKAAWGQKSSPDHKILNPIEIPVGQGIVGTVAQTGQPELVPDTRADARYIQDDAQRLSELAVPLLSEGRVIGVIDSENAQKNFYTPWHLQLLTTIAALCSNKIALAQSEESRQHAMLEAIDNQRKAAESKLQSLRLQMNPHFLFNALNSIQQMTMTGNGDGAALYLSKFSKLLRMVLTHSDHDRISLREELEMLQLYLELESLRFDDTFAYAITCEDGLDKDEYKVPTLLIQPFVENAIWHGLLHKEGRRNLKVAFETTPEEDLVCIIEDNGIGREAAGLYAHKTQRTGKGVSISEDRLQTINQQQNQKNTLEIKDLYDETGAPGGTRVKITLG